MGAPQKWMDEDDRTLLVSRWVDSLFAARGYEFRETVSVVVDGLVRARFFRPKPTRQAKARAA